MNLFTNKKGDLSLSVNAIVILVIAIIFLGLAIGFTTKLIGSSKDKLLAGVEGVDISTPASSDNPITFDGKLEVKSGGKVPIKISFYNADSAELKNAQPYVSTCYNDAGDVVSPVPINLTTIPSNVSAYKETRYQAMLSASGSAADYICVLKVKTTSGSSTFSKQVAMKITG